MYGVFGKVWIMEFKATLADELFQAELWLHSSLWWYIVLIHSPSESQGIQGRLGQIRDWLYKAWEAIYISAKFWYLYNGLCLSDGAWAISRSRIIAVGMIDPAHTQCRLNAIVWDVSQHFRLWLHQFHEHQPRRGVILLPVNCIWEFFSLEKPKL